jgi:hypothetical protein
MARMTEEQFAEYAQRQAKAKQALELRLSPPVVGETVDVVPIQKTKYRNRPTGGYASVKESRRAATLKMMAKAGQIADLREQVPYVLIPTQRIGGKIIERECKYVADFVYRQGAMLVVEDCKGMRTRDYIIKRKLMLQVHGIQIKET